MSENKTEKRKPKNPIKFGIDLNEEQKLAKAQILENEVTVIRGNAGSGKTLLACQAALDCFFTHKVGKIIIARPAVDADEDIGFLPGSEKEKLEPFLTPIMDNFTQLYGDTKTKLDKLEKHIELGDIEIAPIGKLRGRTFLNAFVIIDEAQNLTVKQMEMVLTRLGHNSKMVITGDLRQTDLKCESGLNKLVSLVGKINSLASVQLEQNHRSGIVKEILDLW